MKSTSASGATIRFDDRGAVAPALLLMPGWCVERDIFDDLVPRLAEHNRVLALDWRGHGDSQHPEDEFDSHEMVEDALAVIEASEAKSIIPVALAHAGWIAIELRQRLGERVPKLILLDWIVGDPPPEFLQLIEEMQTKRWQGARDRIFDMWRAGVKNERVEAYLHDVMSKYGGAMWTRAARSIGAAYAEYGTPMHELSRIEPPVPVLHLYSQSPDKHFAEMQAVFAAGHPWYSFKKLRAKTHFAMLEAPDEMARAITEFVQKEVQRTAA
jgi:pimeloyl-ACP methyl ester carboxylesterase